MVILERFSGSSSLAFYMLEIPPQVKQETGQELGKGEADSGSLVGAWAESAQVLISNKVRQSAVR